MHVIDPRQATVFVVEDNHHNLFLFEILLIEGVGIRYYQGVTKGNDLFDAITKHPAMNIDIVLLDIRLPGDDGYTVCQKMRDHPRFTKTTIIAITAEGTPDAVRKAREAGFDGFLTKPIERHRFPDQIRRICAGESIWEYRQ